MYARRFSLQGGLKKSLKLLYIFLLEHPVYNHNMDAKNLWAQVERCFSNSVEFFLACAENIFMKNGTNGQNLERIRNSKLQNIIVCFL